MVTSFDFGQDAPIINRNPGTANAQDNNPFYNRSLPQGTGQSTLADLIALMRPQQAAPVAAKVADNPYRAQLNKLLANPGSMASSPMYQYAMDQGMNAAGRGLAARGMLNSGNRLLEMQKAGQGVASTNFFKLGDLLSGITGQKDSSNLAAAGQTNAFNLASSGQQDASNLNWAKLGQNQSQFDVLHPQGGQQGYRATTNPLTFY